ncbi:MAG: hypothetical protein ABSF54_28735 [Bryobacteraceae bacterium]|jgi:hypothetical protein
MTSRNLARRLEWLDESLLPTNEEPLGMRIESVSPEGERVDSGIEFRILAAPKPIYEKRCAVKAIANRPRRLEDQLPPLKRKRGVFRIMLVRLDREPGLEGVICHRDWWPNDIVHESVMLRQASPSTATTEKH